MSTTRPSPSSTHLPPRTATAAAVAVRVTATNTGSTTWTTAAGYRLGRQDPQDNLTWGLGRVDLAQPTVDPGQTATFDFVATTPNVVGGYAFCWQMVHEAVRWFGQRSASIHIGVGSLGGVCEQLHDRHRNLAAQLAETRAEINAIDWSEPRYAHQQATALAARARGIVKQLELVESHQQANGCAPDRPLLDSPDKADPVRKDHSHPQGAPEFNATH